MTETTRSPRVTRCTSRISSSARPLEDQVNAATAADDLAALQVAVREKVERLDIAIEANPSSNLHLADLADLKKHPIWALNSPELITKGRAIPITVGSDDPMTFSTDLPQEYQKLSDALSDNGFSELATLQWLDNVRETGMRYRFTLPSAQFIDMDMTDLLGSTRQSNC